MAGNYAQLLDIINNPTQHGLPAWDNNAKQIEGETIQQYLLSIINSLTVGYQFMGIASENTSGGTPDQNVFYIAGAGTYTGFGSNPITVDVGYIGIIRWNGAWSSDTIKIADVVSVSQNTLIIGDEERAFLGKPISLLPIINSCVKELYVNMSIAFTNQKYFRFYYGWNSWYGLELRDTHDVVIFDCKKQLDSAPTDSLFVVGNVYCIVDWSKIATECGVPKFKDYTLVDIINEDVVKDLNYNPSIKATILNNEVDNNTENTPVIDSTKLVLSGGLYKNNFGSIDRYLYNQCQINSNSSINNISFGKDSNGNRIAVVNETGDTINMYFGFNGGNSPLRFKANINYRFIAKFKNSGFDTSKFLGLIQAWSGDTKILQTTAPIRVDGDYIYVEYDFSHTSDFVFNWFCLYQPYSATTIQGSSLTYLDFIVINKDILNEDRLSGLFSKQSRMIAFDAIEGNKFYDNVIDIYPNNTPCQIANAIRAITDNSEYNKYLVIVHNGTYQEIDIVTKDYVDIVGENRDKVILVCDGSATYNAPNDYSLNSAYSGVPVNEIPWNYKHLILHCSYSVVANMTLSTTGGASKYISHQDGFTRPFNCAEFKDCLFLNGGSSQIIGVGIFGNQKYVYTNCHFIELQRTNLIQSKMNLHNWDNQSYEAIVSFRDCVFTHTGWISVVELGSGQSDKFEFINCVTDQDYCHIVYSANNPSSEYCIDLNVTGGNLFIIAEDSRKDAGFNIRAKNILMNASLGGVFGNAVDKDGYVVTNANNGYYFLITPNVGNDLQITNSDIIGYGLAVADTYSLGDLLYINNGKFTKTENGSVAGKVLIASTLANDGYLLIRKLV